MTAPWLVPAFLLTALLYAAAGLGGGSTYLALLTLTALPSHAIVAVALTCNALVVTQATLQHARAGTVPWRALAPLLATSVPAAFVAAWTPLSDPAFFVILGVALVVAGFAMTLPLPAPLLRRLEAHPLGPRGLALLGLAVGALAGLTGIGGGIYLSPILHGARWAPARSIAATTSVFILLNSLSGLAGRAATLPATLGALGVHALLPVAVLLGGLVGSRLSLTHWDGATLRWITGLVVLAAGLRVLGQQLG